MLVRAYRLSDKFGVMVLKSTIALTDAALALIGWGVSLVWGVVSTVGRIVWRAVRAVLRVIAFVVRGLLALIGGAALFFVRLAARLSGNAAQQAGSAAGTAMARRKARAELEAGLKEDPLRTQNRVLSGFTVVLLAVLIGVVLWATNPARNMPSGIAAAGNINLAAFPAATQNPNVAAPILPTTVPTATPIPSILEARGTLTYTVRENAQEDIWAVGVGERTPIRLTNSPEDDRDPVWSPDGRRLAYASRQDGNWEIYIYDLFSGSTTRMTYDLSFQAAPRWSPDGEWLVYESYQGNNLDVHVMRVDGSQVERLTEHSAPDFSPAWSPDGRRIAFVSWRDGNQDIYVFSLDDPRDAAAVNLTNTPTRNEDYPAWSPDGKLLAYSALDEGVEKVFVKPADNPDTIAQALGRGRAPTWSPDGTSLIAAVDSVEGTQLIAIPFAGTGFATLVIPVARGASDPDWTAAPLPQAVVNSGGLAAATNGPLYIEQEQTYQVDAPYRLQNLIGVEAPVPALSDRVNDSFNALREHVNEKAGWDFLGQLEDAFWPIERLPQPGEERRNWLMTGRAFAINRNLIVGFPARIELVREDVDIYTFWRVYARVSEDAQNGELGEPLRRMPWDFASRNQGDIDAYNQGGRLRTEMPSGYYIDVTELAADYGWSRYPAGNDWRANFNSVNYWLFYKPEGLAWYDAMLEIYTEPQLGGFAPRPTVSPLQPQQQATLQAEEATPQLDLDLVEVTATALPSAATPAQLLPPPPTVEFDLEEGAS